MHRSNCVAVGTGPYRMTRYSRFAERVAKCSAVRPQASIHGYSDPLAKIVLKAANCFVIDAVGEQKCIEIELDRMESQKASQSQNEIGLRHALTKLDGRVSIGPVGPKLRFWPTRRTLWEHSLQG